MTYGEATIGDAIRPDEFKPICCRTCLDIFYPNSLGQLFHVHELGETKKREEQARRENFCSHACKQRFAVMSSEALVQYHAQRALAPLLTRIAEALEKS